MGKISYMELDDTDTSGDTVILRATTTSPVSVAPHRARRRTYTHTRPPRQTSGLADWLTEWE